MGKAAQRNVSAALFRLGDEIWLETEHTIVMLPPDHEAADQIPRDRLVDDPELDGFVANLRSGAAGMRVGVTVDEAAGTATAAGVPVDHKGYAIVAAVWGERPIHWHLKNNRLRALAEGRVVAEIAVADGVNAFEMILADVDGELWSCNLHFGLWVNDIRGKLTDEQWKHVTRDGKAIDAVRSVLARPLPRASEPREDGQFVWIGPARVQKLYFEMLNGRFRAGATWHSWGHTDPVIACAGGRRIAVVMPWAMHSKGGSA